MREFGLGRTTLSNDFPSLLHFWLRQGHFGRILLLGRNVDSLKLDGACPHPLEQERILLPIVVTTLYRTERGVGLYHLVIFSSMGIQGVDSGSRESSSAIDLARLLDVDPCTDVLRVAIQ